VGRVGFDKSSVDGERVEAFEGLSAQVIPPNTAEQHGVTAQSPCHDRKVRRSAA